MKKKSASQRAPKLSSKTIILLTVAALVLFSSQGSRAAALCGCIRSWDNAGAGDWFNPSNWAPYHDFVPACASNACPEDGGTIEADINNGGTAQISGLSQTAHACETFLGKDSGQSGNLSVDHATLDMCSEMHVGYDGKGVLTIKNGGLVTTPVGADIAADSGSSGSTTVDGTNPDGRKSTWTVTSNGNLFVGGTNSSAGGTGLLTVTNDGMVNAVNVHVYESGTLTGNGTVTATSGTTVEGTLTPSGGTLAIVGDLTFSGHAATLECSIVPSGADNITVSGAASLTGARISVTMTGTFTAGTTYTLLQASGGLNSTRFAIVSIKGASGNCFTPTITYDDNHVYLYLEPDPSCN